MRAVTHIHTRFSWDSRSRIERLVDELEGLHIALALVSDHDSFAGSQELARTVADRGLDIQVPLAAEVRTDRGDVIVVLEAGPPPDVGDLLSWDTLLPTVRERGGLIWLPHPYRSHSEVEGLASEADVIEVFNARCSVSQNERARALCEQHGATPAYGADAHWVREVGSVVVDYPPQATVLETLRTTPRPAQVAVARRSDVMAAEVVNGFTRRRVTLVGYFGLRWIHERGRELLSNDRRRQ